MSTSTPPSAGRERLFALLATSLVGILLFGLAEAGLRYRESLRRLEVPIMAENPHGTGSYRLEPSFSLDTRVNRRPIRLETNRHGMHWRPVEVAKPEGRQRIAFLGDSFTFGSWAGDVAGSFVGVFDAKMPPETYETLNFGVGGYGLDDMELILEEEVLRFAPDFVVLMVFNGNDFRDTHLGLDKYEIRDGTLHWREENLERRVPPELRKEPAKPSSADRGLIETIRWGLYDSLAVYRALSEVKQALRGRPISELPASRPFPELSLEDRFLSYTFWCRDPYPPVARRAVETAITTLDRIRTKLLAEGVELRIATIPFREQVYVENPTGDGYEIGRPQIFIEQFTQTHGLAYLDLLPPLREHVRSTGEDLYTPGDPHFNVAGHALAGRLVAEWFLSHQPVSRDGHETSDHVQVDT